eukprot:TRINITY_DN3350_c0_g1_i1.p1 TRINITY_DN3350_c0_g1~~TRINITY_DN3350_c0_g1_i1.p1  ORF type:complete len:768 (-),score=106.22 TRINITY_DN3350_c0_g1_i1:180-2483(-)
MAGSAAWKPNQQCQWLAAAQARLNPTVRACPVGASAPASPATISNPVLSRASIAAFRKRPSDAGTLPFPVPASNPVLTRAPPSPATASHPVHARALVNARESLPVDTGSSELVRPASEAPASNPVLARAPPSPATALNPVHARALVHACETRPADMGSSAPVRPPSEAPASNHVLVRAPPTPATASNPARARALVNARESLFFDTGSSQPVGPPFEAPASTPALARALPSPASTSNPVRARALVNARKSLPVDTGSSGLVRSSELIRLSSSTATGSNPVLPRAHSSNFWRGSSAKGTSEPVVSTPSPACASNQGLPKACLTALPKRPSTTGSSEPVSILGCGIGGIEELRQVVDDSTVAWALLRFQVGGGTFLRTKLIAIHCNGAVTPVMQRGLLNARSKEVLSHLGEVHASLEVTSGSELTIEYLCERLLRLFAADNMDLSLQALLQDYSRMVREAEEAARRRAVEAAEMAEVSRRRASEARRGAAAEAATAEAAAAEATAKLAQKAETPTPVLQDISVEDALRDVSADRGIFNWLLLDPSRSLGLHKAGDGGLDEMKTYLAENRVLFGALRLSFGHGLTKHVLVHWVGQHVSIVRRGVWNARSGEASTLIGKWCSLTLRKEAHQLKDLDLDDIVMELRRFTVLGLAAGDVASRISVEEYRIALAEETREREALLEQQKRQAMLEQGQEALSSKWGLELVEDAEDKDLHYHDQVAETNEQTQLPELKTAVASVRDADGAWNWVLCGWPPLPPAVRLPPSPCRAVRS